MPESVQKQFGQMQIRHICDFHHPPFTAKIRTARVWKRDTFNDLCYPKDAGVIYDCWLNWFSTDWDRWISQGWQNCLPTVLNGIRWMQGIWLKNPFSIAIFLLSVIFWLGGYFHSLTSLSAQKNSTVSGFHINPASGIPYHYGPHRFKNSRLTGDGQNQLISLVLTAILLKYQQV